MGYLDLKNEKEHLNCIRRILSRRGLSPDLKNEWEIHGPHQDFNYQVYVGYALPRNKKDKCKVCDLPWMKCKAHVNFYCVAIYPRAVYEIEDPTKWASPTEEDRISVL